MKSVVLNTYIRKGKKILNHNFNLRKLGKEEQINPTVIRTKKISRTKSVEYKKNNPNTEKLVKPKVLFLRRSLTLTYP